MAGKAKYSEIVQAILDGAYDGDLAMIQQAAAHRVKNLYRKGTRVRLVGTKNPSLDGKTGVVLKANQKTVTVGVGEAVVEGAGTPWAMTVYSDGEYNVPPAMLAKVEA